MPVLSPARFAGAAVALSLALAPGALGSVARADERSDAAALFDRGRALVKAGDHEAACPLFERSLALVPALGTELNLARCYVETGRLVAALALFEALVPKTVEAKQPQREALARAGVEELRGRVPRLVISRGAALAADVAIRIDGAEVDATAPVPVDPGRHEVTADGARTIAVTAVEGELQPVALEPAPARSAPAVAPAPAPTPAQPAAGGSRARYVLAAGGATLLLASAVSGLATLRVRDAGTRRCVEQAGGLGCDARGEELLGNARTLSHLTTGLAIGGAALAATAVVLHLRRDRGRRETPTAWLAPTGRGLALGGAW